MFLSLFVVKLLVVILKITSWLDAHDPERQAEYELTIRPYWNELKKQFTDEELQLFKNITGLELCLNSKMM